MGVLKFLGFAVVAACAVLIILHPWQAAFAIGIHPYPAGTPWTYQLWSGVLPSLGILSLIGGIVSHYKAINCHVSTCWRIGKYPMAGGQFKVCRKHSHHPDKITSSYILGKHEEHMTCTGHSSSSPPA